MVSSNCERNRVSLWYRPSAAALPRGTSPFTCERKKLRSCLMTCTSRMSVTGGGFFAIGASVPFSVHGDGDVRLRRDGQVDACQDEGASHGRPPARHLREER